MQKTGYEIVQRNGQRIYGGPPPNWRGPPPCKGTEIFVGKVPREMFEWELVPIFETVIHFILLDISLNGVVYVVGMLMIFL